MGFVSFFKKMMKQSRCSGSLPVSVSVSARERALAKGQMGVKRLSIYLRSHENFCGVVSSFL